MRKSSKRIIALMLVFVMMFVLVGCGKNKDKNKKEDTTEATTEATTEVTTEEQPQVDEEGFTIVDQTIKTTDIVNVRKGPSTDAEIAMQLANDVEVNRIGYNDEWSKVSLDGQTLYIYSQYVSVVSDASAGGDSVTAQGPVNTNGRVICIDAGHQAEPNTGEEPVGPGATENKTKVSAGTMGVSTGKPEYELTLEIALKLQAELTDRGYTVVMIRTTNDVNISNAARAEMANQEHADAFVRIHANGSTNSDDKGCLTICQTPSNPYNSNIYNSSRSLATAVLTGLSASTGAKSEGVWETDTMSGINWSSVPVTIVEVGYLTNAEEEQLLISEEYQKKIATGIANGIDSYIGSLSVSE